MSEIGLVCRSRQPSQEEIASMDKAKAIASTKFKYNQYIVSGLLYTIQYFEGHVFGSVGQIAPYCKLKVK